MSIGVTSHFHQLRPKEVPFLAAAQLYGRYTGNRDVQEALSVLFFSGYRRGDKQVEMQHMRIRTT